MAKDLPEPYGSRKALLRDLATLAYGAAEDERKRLETRPVKVLSPKAVEIAVERLYRRWESDELAWPSLMRAVRTFGRRMFHRSRGSRVAHPRGDDPARRPA